MVWSYDPDWWSGMVTMWLVMLGATVVVGVLILGLLCWVFTRDWAVESPRHKESPA